MKFAISGWMFGLLCVPAIAQGQPSVASSDGSTPDRVSGTVQRVPIVPSATSEPADSIPPVTQAIARVAGSISDRVTAASATGSASKSANLLQEGHSVDAQASSEVDSARELQQVIRRAMDELDAKQLPEFETAKHELLAAIQQIEKYVDPSTQRGQDWARFLRLQEMRDELEQEFPNAAKFAELEMNMRQNYLGLEYGYFLALRDALNKTKRALRYGADPQRTIEVLNRRMEALVESLETASTTSDFQLTEDISRVVNYLCESEQVPWAVAELRETFSSPNIQVFAKESMLNRLLARAVAEPSPVDECILGTHVLGRACLQGSVSADILPMEDSVSLNLNLSGQLDSVNRGYNRGVVLRTTGTSPVFACKQIVVGPNGISSSPASVSTDLKTTIHAIEHKLEIVRRIAKRKAAEQKPQADAIAQGRMQYRLRTKYDEQVEEQLAQSRERMSKLQPNGQPPAELRRLEIPRPELAVYSTDATVHAEIVQAASFQLAAGTPCQLPRPETAGAVVEIHQSLAINTLESFLADRTIRDDDIDDFAKQLLGEVPEELKNPEKSDPFVVTMVSFNPVQIHFDDDQIKLVLRFSQMEGNEQSVQGGAQISVVYAASLQDGMLTLNRVGDLEIELPGIRSPTRATTLRSAIRAKLEPVFEAEIRMEKIDYSKLFPNAPGLDIDSVKIDDGWLQIGIR